MNHELWQAWASDVGNGSASAQEFESLVARYREPHRHYHGIEHLSLVLAKAGHLMAREPVSDPVAVRLALWYHDAIYDPRSSGNEAASAELARQRLSILGQPSERIARIEGLILATAAHNVGRDDPELAVVVDADLSILGADPSAYLAYRLGVRAEYGYVDDRAWRSGRAAVLRSFLDRGVIYSTTTMRRREPMARANLAGELAMLTGDQ